MSSNGKFKPGQSGNPKTRFKPGNPHRWQPGQSGNPAGIARRRREFEEPFYAALLEQGSAEEAACLLWDAARDGEPWAIQALLQRLAPESKQINAPAADLAAKLSAVSKAIRADSDVFAAEIRSAPQPHAPALQNKPAEQLETREAETSLRLTYYPERWERWSK